MKNLRIQPKGKSDKVFAPSSHYPRLERVRGLRISLGDSRLRAVVLETIRKPSQIPLPLLIPVLNVAANC